MREAGLVQEVQDYMCKMSKKSKREQQQKWLRTSHSCTTSWLLVLTQKSQSGQILIFEPLLCCNGRCSAMRVLQQQVNEFTDFDNQENVPSVDTLELTLFDVKSKSSQIWSKLRRNVRVHKFRLKMCGASQYKPNRSKSTSTYI